MKNYYEILEVNENASKEVIDKAYKVLAKKYHPDLQEDKNKKAAEEKIKSLNEAYEVLSNTEKRQAYDNKIARIREEEERKKQVEQQQYVSSIKNIYTSQHTNDLKDNTAVHKQFKKEYNRELRKLRIQGFARKVFAIFIVLFIFFLICFIIYKIPATNRWLHNLYEDNIMIKSIIDAIS